MSANCPAPTPATLVQSARLLAEIEQAGGVAKWLGVEDRRRAVSDRTGRGAAERRPAGH